jgi:beta-N-acetylhexosaminidase
VHEFFASYARVGIKAFLFPGVLSLDPEWLAVLVRLARRATADAELGQALIVVGGGSEPAFGLPPFPRSPTPLGLASLGMAAAARRAGSLLGAFLASCGVDMVLGPRLDLASDPKDPAGALDGFGEDSRLAGVLGAAYARGLARTGVAACVGRFPGLGSTSRDNYEGTAIISLPSLRLERCEMRPFARASASRVPATLVGRVLVPSLESERIPASASARVIEGRLRDALGFRGLVVGDDVGPDEDPGKAAVLSALAGCDLCLLSRPDDALTAADALGKAAAAGELPAIRIESAHRRFDRLVASRPRQRPEAISGPSVVPVKFWKSKLRRIERDFEDGVSLLRGALKLDGADRQDFKAVLGVVFLPSPDSSDASETERVLSAIKTELPGAEVLGLPADPGKRDVDDLVSVLSSHLPYAEAAILTYDAHFRPAQESLARLIGEYLPRFRLIAMRDPYDAAFFPKAVGLGAAYGFSESCARAAARLLSGKLKARGGHPVEVIGLEV